MRKLIHYFISGIGFGSAVYIIYLLNFDFIPTWSNVLVTWLFSGGMGLAALLFDWEPKWAWLPFLCHWIVVFTLVLGMLVINGWYVPLGYDWLGFLFSFAMIYLVIYLYLLWQNWHSVEKINQKLVSNRNNS